MFPSFSMCLLELFVSKNERKKITIFRLVFLFCFAFIFGIKSIAYFLRTMRAVNGKKEFSIQTKMHITVYNI